jgi:hypothetical protein
MTFIAQNTPFLDFYQRINLVNFSCEFRSTLHLGRVGGALRRACRNYANARGLLAWQLLFTLNSDDNF